MFLGFIYSVMNLLRPGIMRNVPQLDKSICMTKHCLRTVEMYTNSMNAVVHPCDNFFEYACANYPIHNQILPYRDVSASFDTRRENVDKIVLDHIKSINRLWPKGFQKVRTFYDLCMNEDQRRQLGYDTLQEQLADIGMNLLPPFHLKTEPRKDFSEILGKIHRLSVGASSFLHRVIVRPLPVKMKLNTLFIGSVIDPTANGSVLPPEENILTDRRERFMISVINHLYDHLKYELTDDMRREIKQRVDDVLALHDSLNEMVNSMKNNGTRKSHRYMKPFQVKAVINEILEGGEIQINFTEYLETLYTGFLSLQKQLVKALINDRNSPPVITITPFEEFVETYKILRNTRSLVFESLIWWTVVNSILEEGPAQLHKFLKGCQATVMMEIGSHIFEPRDVHCMREIREYFGNFAGFVLAKTTNGRKKKKKITEMFENIKLSYEESIQRTHWADDETKEATLAKIRSMRAYIGFDDSLLEPITIDREYRRIDIQPGNYYKLVAALFREKRKKELFKLFATNDFDEKPEVNPVFLEGAYYSRAYNYVVIPISDIQFPRYDLGLEVLHYATIGYVLSHEVGHSIDHSGSLYNAGGDLVFPMSDDASKTYNQIADCFIEAFNNLYVYIPGKGFIRVNGRVSVNENMADWQGFNIGLLAYKKYVEKHGVEQKLPSIFSKFTPEQLYSLAYANLYCVNARPQYLIQSATTDSHAPERARVNGILKNSKQFSDAYGCDADAPMNPPNKCEIWFRRI